MVKSLLLKNYYIMRNGLKSTLSILLILLFFTGCIISSINSGNMHHYLGTSLDSFRTTIRQITYIISSTPLLCALDVITFHSKDKLSNWNKMLYSTPAKPWQKIMADYLLTYITLFIGFLSGIVLCPLILRISGIAVHFSAFLILFKVLIIMCVLMALILPFYTAFDEIGGAVCLMTLFVCITAIIFLSQNGNGNLTGFGNTVKHYISVFNHYTILIAICVAVLISISYIISLNIEKRRRYTLC